MANIFSKLYDYADASLDSRIGGLRKDDTDAGTEVLAKGEKVDGTIGRKGLLFDPIVDVAYASGGLYQPRGSLITNVALKQVSRKNPIVAIAIDVRASQAASAAKLPENRFEMGIEIGPKVKGEQVDPEEKRKIEEFILNCGFTENRSEPDRMTFDQWCYAIVRDFMIYGHAAVEKVRKKDGSLYCFLPLPGESIFFATKDADKGMIESMKASFALRLDPNKAEVDDTNDDNIEYVQVIEGKVVEGFSSKELAFVKLYTESDLDLRSYCVGPLERAISAIISSMQIENHQRQFFANGTASRGVFTINGDCTPNQLRTLQAQWNQITGPVNAWRTPVLAGIKSASFIPLTMSNRDMEYAAYQDHILRILFSCFAMDPEEAGFGHLSKGTEQRSMSESSNEWRMTASRDRGLRPVLGRIEALINETIIPDAFGKAVSERVHFRFVGLDSETRMEELSRQQVEVSLHTTLNEARREAERKELPIGGNLILNPLLLQILQNNMTKGQFMEQFMGIQGAAQDPQYSYLPDPMWFQWQQMQIQLTQMQSGGEPQDPNGDDDAPKETDKKSKSRSDDSAAEGDEPSEEEQEAAQQQAQQQSSAVEQYIAANPTLFKSMLTNWKTDSDLKKTEFKHRKIRNDHVEKMTSSLVKDFRQSSSLLIKEILEVVKEDMDAQTKKPKKDT